MRTRRHRTSICLVLLSVLAAGCSLDQSSRMATVTTTPPASSTPPPAPTPASTLTPTPTLSPTPTSTAVPALGEPLRSDNWEATVLQAVFRKSISIAGTVYTPKPGYMGFDVIMKVKNLNPTSNPSTLVEHDVIIDQQGSAWLATCWGALDTAKAEGKDLLNLTFVGCQTGNIYSMRIDSESYLRFHFTIKDTNLGKPLVFKFEDLPPLPLIINNQ